MSHAVYKIQLRPKKEQTIKMVAEVANMSVRKLKAYSRNIRTFGRYSWIQGSEAPAADLQERSPHKEILQPRINGALLLRILPLWEGAEHTPVSRVPSVVIRRRRGQRQVTEVLEKAIVNKKIAHAYLFAGGGTGKTSVSTYTRARARRVQ